VLDQESAETGNSAGLLITPTIISAQSFACGLSGELLTESGRMATVATGGNSNLVLRLREGSLPGGTLITSQTFSVTGEVLQWYDVDLDPGTFVEAGDSIFLEVQVISGGNVSWDWVYDTDVYPGGTAWQFNNGNWIQVPASDVVFRTYVAGVTQQEILSVTSAGKVKINNKYMLPSVDGEADQVMVSNGAGVLSWQDVTGMSGGSSIADTDGNTLVQVEESPDDDIIRFDMGGTEYFRMNLGRLATLNTGHSVFIGEAAGVNDDLTFNNNVFIGYLSGNQNTSGASNAAVGFQSLYFNETGSANTAIGEVALVNNVSGSSNIAIGSAALSGNSSGDNNTAIGAESLGFNDFGNYNSALGYRAGLFVADFDNTTSIGYDANASASNRIHIGNNNITWIGGQVGWSTYSDRRMKTDISDDVAGLEFIQKLRPVTYHIDLGAIDAFKASNGRSAGEMEYADQHEIESYLFSGFIAQEVETAAEQAGYQFSGLCPPKNDGDFYSLRYAEFVVPLVKAVQELSAENLQLKQEQASVMQLVADLESRLRALELLE
jgi:hypothetical protein